MLVVFSDCQGSCSWRVQDAELQSVVLIVLARLDVEVELLVRDGLIDGQNVLRRRFEVARGIVALRNVECFLRGVVDRLVNVADAREHLKNVAAQEVDSGLDLNVGVVRLNRGRDDHDAETSGANGMSRRNHGNVDIWESG